jgi:hypothetical protein
MAGELGKSVTRARIDHRIIWPVDYRQFANDNPESLAKAIEQGIPKSLRGMMWQLMFVRLFVLLERV